MTVQGFIRWMIATLSADMEKLAAEIASQGMNHDSYLIAVGKYRQMKSTIERLRERLSKTDASPEVYEESAEMETEVIARPEPKSSPKRSKPRPWGGGQ